MNTPFTKSEGARQIDQAIDLLRLEDYDSAIAQACTARGSPMTDAERVRAKYNPAMAAKDIIGQVVGDYWRRWQEESSAMVWFKETHQQPKR